MSIAKTHAQLLQEFAKALQFQQLASEVFKDSRPMTKEEREAYRKALAQQSKPMR